AGKCLTRSPGGPPGNDSADPEATRLGDTVSAIGSCVRMKTSDLDRCLALAGGITPPQKSRWPWQKKLDTGRDAFVREWAAAVLEEMVFDGSGYLLASYFLAQNEMNGLTDPFDEPEGLMLAKVFTAAFPVRVPHSLPALEPNALAAFCNKEWGDNGPGKCEGITRVDAFLKAGISRIDDNHSVVFIIS